MPATTIKLSPVLKQRVAELVRDTGQSVHAFLVEAIERQTALAERRKAFVADALAAREQATASGRAYALEDVRRYYTARAADKPARKPRAKQWRK